MKKSVQGARLAFSSVMLRKTRASKKQSYLEDNMASIREAMAAGDISRDPQSAAAYLESFSKLLLIVEENSQFDGSNLFGATQFFYQQTKADVEQAFFTLFQADPLAAIVLAKPPRLFKEVFYTAMEGLVFHDDPHLYFQCLKNIPYGDDEDYKKAVEANLAHYTESALGHLLSMRPDIYAVHEEEYLGYLSLIAQDHFVNDHLDKIRFCRAAANNKNGAHRFSVTTPFPSIISG